MKKTTFLAAFCCFAFLSNAQNNETSIAPAMEMTSSNEVKQELVTTSNGVEVYYSSSNMVGNTLLDIHFVNTTDESVTFTWEIEKSGSFFKGQKSITLRPGKSYDQKSVLEVKGTTDLSDYSITLTKK